MADRTAGRIIVKAELIVCSVHGDATEAETLMVGDRPIHTRWTCVECGAARTFSTREATHG